ncbi:rna-directed dna polymerase from mobile element jockey- hypothetical protein [Limosa lapponica baueri]|uniref:Uncharacterized protein n=1 Tax=Limosa lapponica baueri TaxID=1758121 RepID=A0A2I0UC90_LIMLA|nr:rna-directed dna polymerase from mobile element jockey- hypothetical protein [Limosa lapponica baueri]
MNTRKQKKCVNKPYTSVPSPNRVCCVFGDDIQNKSLHYFPRDREPVYLLENWFISASIIGRTIILILRLIVTPGPSPTPTKGFFNYIGGKRTTRENVSLLLNETGAMVSEDAEKVELLNAFFASVFTAQASPWEPQNLEESEKVWTKEALPLVQEDQVKELLPELDTHKSMGPDGMHLRVLRELAEVIAESLSIIFERSWRTGEVPEDWRKASVIPVFKKGKKEDLGNYRLVSLIFVPGKMMERLVLGFISKRMEEKKAIRSSQHGFTKGKSCLTNLIAFYDGITGWIDERRAVDVVYLDFSKDFDTVSHSIFIDKPRKCGLEEWTVRDVVREEECSSFCYIDLARENNSVIK